MYLYDNQNWPVFEWNSEKLLPLLSYVRNKQGKLIGKMGSLGFELQNEANLEILTIEIVKSTEIEGEILDREQVRSSIARRLGLDISGLVYSERNVDGMVDLMLDATKNYNKELTKERLFSWHASLFPAGQSGMYKIITGNWRDDSTGPMQVVSGPMGRRKIHFQAPPAGMLAAETARFLAWANTEAGEPALVRAGLAHLWFVTLHPFDDGNGRIARAVGDLFLARADGSAQRFYSLSAQIQRERRDYYDVLERTQKGSLDVTGWLAWFLGTLGRAIASAQITLDAVLLKARFWQRWAGTPLNERQAKLLNRLLDGFDGKLTSSKWAAIAKCSPDTALRDITQLLELGVLKKSPGGGRSTGYELAS